MVYGGATSRKVHFGTLSVRCCERSMERGRAMIVMIGV